MTINYMNLQPMSTNLSKVVIFGTLENSELAHYYLKMDSDYEVVAFTVNKEYNILKVFQPKEFDIEYPVVDFESIKEYYPPNEYLLFVPISGSKMNLNRKKIYEDGKKNGYKFATYVSSKCIKFNNKIGENCFILENNTLQPYTDIGNNVIIWSGNHIGHHGKIDDHVFLTSHVVISGHCHIKERAWIGVNSSIRDGITIGEGSLIAMGSLITKSVEDNSFYMGVPAKKQNKLPEEVN